MYTTFKNKAKFSHFMNLKQLNHNLRNYFATLQIIRNSLNFKNEEIKILSELNYIPHKKNELGWIDTTDENWIIKLSGDTKLKFKEVIKSKNPEYQEYKLIPLNKLMLNFSRWDGIFKVKEIIPKYNNTSLTILTDHFDLKHIVTQANMFSEYIPKQNEKGFISTSKIIEKNEDLSELVLKTQSGDEIIVANTLGPLWQGALYSFQDKPKKYVALKLDAPTTKEYNWIVYMLSHNDFYATPRNLINLAQTLYLKEFNKKLEIKK